MANHPIRTVSLLSNHSFFQKSTPNFTILTFYLPKLIVEYINADYSESKMRVGSIGRKSSMDSMNKGMNKYQSMKTIEISL